MKVFVLVSKTKKIYHGIQKTADTSGIGGRRSPTNHSGISVSEGDLVKVLQIWSGLALHRAKVESQDNRSCDEESASNAYSQSTSL